MKRFYPEVAEKGMYFHINPLRDGKFITHDSAMAMNHEFIGEEKGEIHKIEAIPEYSVMIVKGP